MDFENLPKWMYAIPTLCGVSLAMIGMQLAPMLGLRATLGPILGMPAGFVIGFAIVAGLVKARGVE